MTKVKPVWRTSLLVLFCAFSVVFFSHMVVQWRSNLNLNKILSSLHKIEASCKPKPVSTNGPFVLVGFGGCLDITVNATDFLSGLGLSSDKIDDDSRDKFQENGVLNTLDDVVAEFDHRFCEGAASERHVSSAALFDKLVAAAAEQLGKKSMAALGGNAAVMAARMFREGNNVTLAARLSLRQHSMLPPNLTILTAPSLPGLSQIPEEDVHLVLEYSKGQIWRNCTSPRANRLILIRDKENPRLSGLWPDLLARWREKNGAEAPDLFVLGGLQTMNNWEGEDDTIVKSRLHDLHQFLVNHLPKSTLTHFEMASFSESDLFTDICKLVLPYFDSLGMNEQEIVLLLSMLKTGALPKEASKSTPRVVDVLDMLREAWALLTDRSLPRVLMSKRHLSRIHLHTLGFQVVMVRRSAKQLSHKERERLLHEHLDPSGRFHHVPLTDLGRAWPYARAAAAKASLIAYRYTCEESSIDPLKTSLLVDEWFDMTTDRTLWPNAGRLPADSSRPALDRVSFNSSSPVFCWLEEEPQLPSQENGGLPNEPRNEAADRLIHTVQFCVAPGLVCRQVKKTAGAGDNISAAALAVQALSQQTQHPTI